MKKDSFPMNKNIVIQKTKLQIRITELIILDQNVDNKEKTKTCKLNAFFILTTNPLSPPSKHMTLTVYLRFIVVINVQTSKSCCFFHFNWKWMPVDGHMVYCIPSKTQNNGSFQMMNLSLSKINSQKQNFIFWSFPGKVYRVSFRYVYTILILSH